MAHEKRDDIIWPAYVDMLTVLVMIFIMFSIVFIIRLSMYNIAQKMTVEMQQKTSTATQQHKHHLPPPIIYMSENAHVTQWDLILSLDNSLNFAKSQQQMIDKWFKTHQQTNNAIYEISIELANQTHISLGAMLRKIYILYAKTANYMHNKHNIPTSQIQFLSQSNQSAGASNLIKIKVKK
ncbi:MULTISPECIES: hypothetical protein [Cysteiniphilum]|uniref:Uncharacterized protein n=1 Tax=Cysteiniphilum litorale TaxID=2056700 RepID=A0A8J2Z4B8_9GAMM|nr:MULTISPECIES: hypothetical protein [Cysteiniphilum]GGF96448.1 hypothetical protein GCM10010995_12140 [Cysteiniphilum litorale]